MKNLLLIILLLAFNTVMQSCASHPSPQKTTLKIGPWKKLNTVEFKGKQDDIYFVNANIGWYGNGKGYLYKTVDGGDTWKEILHKPGTFIRAVGFVDENLGFAGNIGPDYFPGVTDSKPLYKTTDGGTTWKAIHTLSGKNLKGVCAIDVLKAKFINSGVLDHRVTVRAAGRVGGPAKMATSRDGGNTWKTEDLSPLAEMILDVKFLNETTGFICASSSADMEKTKGRILKTTDGGTTWKVVYESKGANELMWKCSFPTDRVGYGTLQSYDEDPKNTQRYVVKTVDGGDTWKEISLVNDHNVREFGIGFINADVGWVGDVNGAYFTEDGGHTWVHQNIGRAVNKFRIIETDDKYIVFAIGSEVYRLEVAKK